jgi:hypothetical protein
MFLVGSILLILLSYSPPLKKKYLNLMETSLFLPSGYALALDMTSRGEQDAAKKAVKSFFLDRGLIYVSLCCLRFTTLL